MSEKSFERNLKSESKKREQMLSDALEELNTYSSRLIEREKDLEQSKIDEIKYKTTINELNEYVDMYKEKVDRLEKSNSKYDKEILSLRKDILKNDTDLKLLKSILQLFVDEYGIDRVIEITNLKKTKIKELMEIGE